MNRVSTATAVVLIAMSTCVAQSTPASSQAGVRNTQAASHAVIPTMLTRSLDAKKLKVGDEVTAKTTVGMQGNGMTIAKGAAVVGHVTQAQTAAKGDPQTSLGIIFDKVQLSDGKWLSMQGTIQAIGPNPNPEPNVGAGGSTLIATDAMGGSAGTMPGPVGTLGDPKDMNPDQNPKKLINPQSTGVIGIRNLQLGPDSVLRTKGKDLKLDSATQVIIKAEFPATGQ